MICMGLCSRVCSDLDGRACSDLYGDLSGALCGRMSNPFASLGGSGSSEEEVEEPEPVSAGSALSGGPAVTCLGGWQ